MLFFGPESARPSLQRDEEFAGESETGTDQHLSPNSKTARKHPRESGPNGAADQAVQPASKRSRKTAPNGPERNSEQQQQQQQNADIITDERVPMQVDHQDEHANSASSDSVPPLPEAKSPSPSDLDQDSDIDMGEANGVVHGLEVSNGASPGAGVGVFEPQDQEQMNELPPAIPTLDSGHSVGVQLVPAKIADSDLVPESSSIILHVADEAHVTSASWRPTDPTLLAASGPDFVGVWRVPDQPSRPGAVLPPFQHVVDKRDDSMVTAMAWEPGGTMLAIAVFDNHTAGAIRIYDGQEAVLIESLPAAQRLITMLKWQKFGSRLMGFSVTGQESSLVMWDLSGSASMPGAFSIAVPEQIHDISWASHGNTSVVCAAADGVIYQCRAVPDLVIDHKWSSTSQDHLNWTFVRCSWCSDETAIIVAASSESSMLWVPTKNAYARGIHNGAMTCLELRPGQMMHPDRDTYCDFATSSVDGTVKIWRYNDQFATIECQFKLSLADAVPILGMAYTPDGQALAAASYDKVVLWKAENRGPSLAKWEGDENSWGGAYLKRHRRVSQGETMSEDGGREDTDHWLAWDAESSRLAFALGNQVCPVLQSHHTLFPLTLPLIF